MTSGAAFLKLVLREHRSLNRDDRQSKTQSQACMAPSISCTRGRRQTAGAALLCVFWVANATSERRQQQQQQQQQLYIWLAAERHRAGRGAEGNGPAGAAGPARPHGTAHDAAARGAEARWGKCGSAILLYAVERCCAGPHCAAHGTGGETIRQMPPTPCEPGFCQMLSRHQHLKQCVCCVLTSHNRSRPRHRSHCRGSCVLQLPSTAGSTGPLMDLPTDRSWESRWSQEGRTLRNRRSALLQNAC